ncbi:CPBP family intramembrane glutamic endopeptidase [Pilimelia columellifera]|uniref:Type II CAAX endopeptidase family protein n=1 Tax=Pilimelia columellifera subsp. columellifera TaxID=706583 RepID=A0ABN3N6S3_9ACTN
MTTPVARQTMSRHALAVAVAVATLVAVNLVAWAGPRHSVIVVGPLSAAALVVLARRAGLSWAELGLGRRGLRAGAVAGAAAVAIVAVGYLAAAALPATRTAFLDERYQLSVGAAALTAFVIIPLATVLPEEIAFRGVLWGLVARACGPVWATGTTSALFGLWHVLPSLRLHQANAAVATVTGGGRAAAVVGAVLFTGLAGVVLAELRRRTGSLLAPIGLHWATNGLGVLMTAALGGRS